MPHIAILILIGLQVFGAGILLAFHGKPKTGNYNFGYTIINLIVVWSLLAWAGVFSNPG